MKRRAIVTNVNDPKKLGRLKAKIVGFGKDDSDLRHRETPWCWPCVPFADGGSGFFMIPPVGAEVWVEQTYEKDFVWTGCFWSGRKAKPTDGEAPDVRVIRTPAGHQFKLDESGDIELLHSNGNYLSLRKDGTIDVVAVKDLTINVSGSTSLDVGGDIKVKAGGDLKADIGGKADIKAGGVVKVDGSQINLNGSSGQVVTTNHICSFTGTPHGQGSSTVKAGG